MLQEYVNYTATTERSQKGGGDDKDRWFLFIPLQSPPAKISQSKAFILTDVLTWLLLSIFAEQMIG
jgi:hypothetical protein